MKKVFYFKKLKNKTLKNILYLYKKDYNRNILSFFFPQKFDLSKMKRLHLKDNANEGVLGKFKDELRGKILTACWAVSPKVYSYKYLGFIVDKFDKN